MVSYLYLHMSFHIIRFVQFQGKQILNSKDSLSSRLYSYRREVDQNIVDRSEQDFLFWFPTSASRPGLLAFTH